MRSHCARGHSLAAVVCLVALAMLLPVAGTTRIATELAGRLHVHAHAALDESHGHHEAQQHVHPSGTDDADDVIYLDEEPEHEHDPPASRRAAQGDGDSPPANALAAARPTAVARPVDRDDAKPAWPPADRIERPPRHTRAT